MADLSWMASQVTCVYIAMAWVIESGKEGERERERERGKAKRSRVTVNLNSRVDTSKGTGRPGDHWSWILGGKNTWRGDGENKRANGSVRCRLDNGKRSVTSNDFDGSCGHLIHAKMGPQAACVRTCRPVNWHVLSRKKEQQIHYKEGAIRHISSQPSEKLNPRCNQNKWHSHQRSLSLSFFLSLFLWRRNTLAEYSLTHSLAEHTGTKRLPNLCWASTSNTDTRY